MLRIGAKVPDFDLEASTDERLTSRDLRDRFAIIIFYPKNDTPG